MSLYGRYRRHVTVLPTYADDGFPTARIPILRMKQLGKATGAVPAATTVVPTASTASPTEAVQQPPPARGHE